HPQSDGGTGRERSAHQFQGTGTRIASPYLLRLVDQEAVLPNAELRPVELAAGRRTNGLLELGFVHRRWSIPATGIRAVGRRALFFPIHTHLAPPVRVSAP